MCDSRVAVQSRSCPGGIRDSVFWGEVIAQGETRRERSVTSGLDVSHPSLGMCWHHFGGGRDGSPPLSIPSINAAFFINYFGDGSTLNLRIFGVFWLCFCFFFLRRKMNPWI